MNFKRLVVSAAVAVPVAAALVVGPAATAQSTDYPPPTPNTMTCYMWAGANFDLSGNNCASANANVPPSPPTGTPTSQSIICNLYAGSNFDLSGDNCNALNANNPTTQQPGSVPQPSQQPPQQQGSNPPYGPNPGTGSGYYAALGDSVAAGLGLPPAQYGYTPGDMPDSHCGLSEQAYPYIVASAFNNGAPYINATCSGATVSDVDGSQLNTAFVEGTPAAVSITVGANDIGWAQVLHSCYSTDCATAANTDTVNGRLSSFQSSLYKLFSDIQARSQGAPPTVVITGYYNPVSDACTGQSNLTSDEINWVSAGVTALNQTIQQTAAAFPFVRYVPVDFTRHDICSSDPWVQGLSDPAPFHPTAEGQQVIAQDVLQAIN